MTMISIGQLAKLASVSTRTIRYYETISLIPLSKRHENNYRYYDQVHVEVLKKIKALQELGFSLDEIKKITAITNDEFKEYLQKQLVKIQNEITDLDQKKNLIQNILSVSHKIETGELLTLNERKIYMDSINEQVLKNIHQIYGGLNDDIQNYLNRDTWVENSEYADDYLNAIKKCIQFAKDRGLTLGPARGSTPASLRMYSLGFSSVDPMKYNMIPERLSTQAPFFHIDVEYGQGQDFVNFCQEENKKLKWGEIQAFKMPLLDIIKSVHQKIGYEINYNEIPDDSDIVLNHFKNVDIEKIFQFDFSEDALVMNFEKFQPEYQGTKAIKKYLHGMNNITFNDIIHITALWRPYTAEIVERINLFKKAKNNKFSYGFLDKEIEQELAATYGMIVYHEDLIKIISYYTGWSRARSNSLRRLLFKPKNNDYLQNTDYLDFKTIVPHEIHDLVVEESKWAFCMPHAISFARFTKQSAVVKSLHPAEYLESIGEFETQYGIRWDDIGIRMKGVSLHQN